MPALPVVLTGVVVGRHRPWTTGPREHRAGSVRWRPTWLPRDRGSLRPHGAAERSWGGGGGTGTGAIMQKIKSLMTRQVSGSGREGSGVPPRLGPEHCIPGGAGTGVCGRARAP